MSTHTQGNHSTQLVGKFSVFKPAQHICKMPRQFWHNKDYQVFRSLWLYADQIIIILLDLAGVQNKITGLFGNLSSKLFGNTRTLVETLHVFVMEKI